ncbi:MAG: fused MFS/spermidine synthase [Kouleothrix sp.]|jgi:predicted membrane-bound spermidine synthase|nr:fused MFS/spermidine synthase [Kouleothrix sp.]
MERDIPAQPQAAPREAAQGSSRFLLLVVFLAGIGTLGIEMIASRLLAPYFGTSQPIWAVVIGLTLIYLTIGYRLGGSLADRRPEEKVLYQIITWAGFITGFIPLLADPILRFSQGTIARVAVGSFLGALFGVLILFAAPVVLMAMVSPFAIRLQLKRVEAGIAAAGRTAGSLSALSTVGSIVGTFLTVLYLIPAIGTARTTYLIAVFLIVVGLIGLRDWRYLLLLLIVGGLFFYTTTTRGNIKTADCGGCTLIDERESAYNYIQIATSTSQSYGPQVNLILNEGQAIHSIYHPRFEQSGDPLDLLTGGGPWDYFAVAPYFFPDRDPAQIKRMAMLGSATGTVPKQFLAIYGADATIDAVEIDPEIIALGRKHFQLRDASNDPAHPNYHTHPEDARYWLATAGGSYDLIGMDAYHQPYIPFHLATVEFFQLVKQHLAPTGVAVVNAGKGPDGDDRLGVALAGTMRQVFPQVFIIDTAGFGNQIVVGVNQPVGDGVRNFQRNFERTQVPVLHTVMDWSLRLGAAPVREFQPADARYAPFTDDKAPVEQLIDSLIFDQIK